MRACVRELNRAAVKRGKPQQGNRKKQKQERELKRDEERKLIDELSRRVIDEAPARSVIIIAFLFRFHVYFTRSVLLMLH